MNLRVYLLTAIVNVFLVYTTLCQSDFWQQTNGPYGGDLSSLAVNPQGYVFAGTWQFNGQNGGRLSRSSDSANTWMMLNVPGRQIQKLLIMRGGTLVVNTDSSLFRSADNGLTWASITGGLVGDSLSP